MRTQKRFKTEEEIIARIDAVKSYIEEKQREWFEMDAKAKELIRSGVEKNVSRGRAIRRQADVLKDKIECKTSKTLVNLKNTLAAFRNQIIPGIVDGTDVVLQTK